MSRIDELPADQRAALSLLLVQGKTYAEVAGLLHVAPQAIHDRAQAALAVLAPQLARALDPALRLEIGDYLLGQAGSGESLRIRTRLADSGAARAWARAVALELAPMAGAGLAEIPPEAGAPPTPAAPQTAPPAAPVAEPTAPALEQTAPAVDPQPAFDPPAPLGPQPAGSRRGGALVLGLILIAAVVAIVIVVGKSGSGSGSSSGSSKTTADTETTTTGTGSVKNEGRFSLHSPNSASKSTGAFEIVSEGKHRALYIQAAHIPESKGKGFFYAVWLYASPTKALALSKSPPVGSKHSFAGLAALPEDVGSYKEVLLTRETSSNPTTPGHIVLQGAFNLSG